MDGQPIPMEAIFLMKLRRVEGVIRILDLCVYEDKYIIIMERPRRVSKADDGKTETEHGDSANQ